MNALTPLRRRVVSAARAGLAVAVVLAAAPAALAGRSLHVSPTGSDSNDCSDVAPCRQIRRALTLVAAGDTVLVADGSYLGFDVEDLHGAPGAPITIKAVGAAAQVTPTTDRSDNRDTIFVTFASHVVIDGLRSSNANRAAVRVDQSQHVTIRNGVFGNNRTWGIFTDFSDDLLIEDNECYGSVAEHGIYVSNSGDRPVVRRNRVHGNHAAGIHVNADASMGGDGIITGALIELNVVYDNGTGGGAAINMDGVQDSTVRNNLLYGNRATGIANYRIDGAQGPKGMNILHNTVDMAATARWALLMWDTSGPNVVRNNILYNRNTARGGILYVSAADVANTDSDYNVLDRVSANDGVTVLTLAQWRAQGHEPHSLSALPSALWVNATGADYHLASASPAVDRGLTLASVTADLEGRARPAGASSDIGAYESGPGTPRLSIGDVRIVEGSSGDTLATVTVTLSPAAAGIVTVAYATADGTAVAPADYTPISGSLTFAPGVTESTITVAVEGDTAAEADETFLVRLSDPAGAGVGDGEGVVTIANDDSAAAVMLSPAPGSKLPSGAVTFSWTPGTGVTQYWLKIGYRPGKGGLYSASQGTRLSVTVSGLPANGRTLHVTLRSRIGGVWVDRAYTYQAAGS